MNKTYLQGGSVSETPRMPAQLRAVTAGSGTVGVLETPGVAAASRGLDQGPSSPDLSPALVQPWGASIHFLPRGQTCPHVSPCTNTPAPGTRLCLCTSLSLSPCLCTSLPLSPCLCTSLPLSPRLCASLPLSPHLCTSLPLSPHLCTSLPLSPCLCTSLPLSPRLCTSLPLSLHLCTSLSLSPHLCLSLCLFRVSFSLPRLCLPPLVPCPCPPWPPGGHFLGLKLPYPSWSLLEVAGGQLAPHTPVAIESQEGLTVFPPSRAPSQMRAFSSAVLSSPGVSPV